MKELQTVALGLIVVLVDVGDPDWVADPLGWLLILVGIAGVRAELPDAEIGGISAGLHATIRFPRPLDEATIVASALKRGMGLSFIRQHYLGPAPDESTLLLSYASMPESVLRSAIRALAGIVTGQR